MSLKRRQNRQRRERDLKKRAAEFDRSLSFRRFSVRAASVNCEARSVEAQITSENPVPMPDWERGEMVPEVLLGSGAVLPDSKQVPLLNDHRRRGMENQLGSIRDLRVEPDGMGVGGSGVVGLLNFSSAHEPEWTKVREGHATDVSAGYQVLEKTHVPKGQTQMIAGRGFSGPVNVATRWKLREGSLVPIGADEAAKLRGLDSSPFLSERKPFAMDAELRKLLVSRGMPAELDDAAAQKWMTDPANQARWLATATSPAAPPKDPKEESARAGAAVTLTADQVSKAIEEGVRKYQEEDRRQKVAFRADVDSLCELADCADLAAKARELPDLPAVRKFLVEQKAERAKENPLRPAGHVRISGEGRERLMTDMKTALVLRCLHAVAPPVDTRPPEMRGRGGIDREAALKQVFPEAERGKGHEQFKHATPFQMAEELLRADGIRTIGMTREQIAIAAMFGIDKAMPGRSTSAGFLGAAYNTTGNFTNITLDAINKSMQLGYVEAPSTWEGPMRRGMSAPDFKNIHRIRLGAIPNLPVWPDNSQPQKAAMADAQEQYAVEARSIEIGYSYRLLVNDDLDMLSRTPAMMGAAGKRTVNATAWAQVTSNPTMSDSVALFSGVTGNRAQSNLVASGSGAVPSTASLQTTWNLLLQMRGENTPENNLGPDILGLQPRYIIGPSALNTTIKQLVLSVYDPAANFFQRYNTAAELIPVIEPLLDGTSTGAWYIFADPMQIDTVEVTFLEGQETPIVRNFLDERSLTQYWTVVQTYAAKALNYRGMIQNFGS